MILSLLFIVIYLAAMMFLCNGGAVNSIIYYIDCPTILLLIIMPLAFIAINGLWKDFWDAMAMSCRQKLKKEEDNTQFTMSKLKKCLYAVEFVQKTVIYSTITVVMFELIMVLHMLESLETLGPYTALIMLAFFYMSLIELALLPVNVTLKKKIAEYMEGED